MLSAKQLLSGLAPGFLCLVLYFQPGGPAETPISCQGTLWDTSQPGQEFWLMDYKLWDESELQAGFPVDAKCLFQAGEGRVGRMKGRSWCTRAGGVRAPQWAFGGHSQGNAHLHLPGIWSQPRADSLDCFAKKLIAISEAEARPKSQQQLESRSEVVVA